MWLKNNRDCRNGSLFYNVKCKKKEGEAKKKKKPKRCLPLSLLGKRSGYRPLLLVISTGEDLLCAEEGFPAPEAS